MITMITGGDENTDSSESAKSDFQRNFPKFEETKATERTLQNRYT